MVIVPLKVKTENRMRMDNITTNLMNLYHKLAMDGLKMMVMSQLLLSLSRSCNTLNKIVSWEDS